MTRLFIYRMANFQFFVNNFSLISIISFIFSAKKSAAVINLLSQNRLSNLNLLKQTDAGTDGKFSEFFLNLRLAVNENDLINRSRAFLARPTKSRKTLIVLILPATCKFRYLFPKPPFRLQDFPSRFRLSTIS